MVKIQLETGLLDVEENTAFPLNFGIADVRDVSKRSGAFSKTITLAGTKNNHDILNHYYDVNVVAGTFDINAITKCIVIQNGLPVMDNATLQLISVNKEQNTDAHEQKITYSVLVKDSQADFFTKIDNKELTDIDFSDLNHNISAANIVASWANTVTDGYKYVLPWSGDNQYPIKEMRPGIYAKTYFDRIFAKAGFDYTWSTLTDARFDKLIVPFNGEAVLSDYTSYIIDASDDQIINGYQATAGINTTFSEQLQSWTENSDASNSFTPLTGTIAVPFVVTGGDGLNIQVTVNYDLNLLNATGGTAYLVGGTGNYFRYKPVITVKKNGTTIVNSSGNQLSGVNKTAGYTIPVGSTTISTQSITFNIPLTNLLSTDTLTFEAGVVCTQYAAQSSTVPRWRDTNLVSGNLLTIDVELDIARIDIVTSFNVSMLPSGALLEVNKVVPSKVKQKDFVKSIFQMYNLYVEVDPSAPNNLILKHRDDYYDGGLEVDWTYKLAKEREQVLQFLPELSSKKLVLSYKQDNDEPNTTYFGAIKEIYGQVEFTFDNEYARGVDTKELIFSPTPIGRTPFNGYAPMIAGMSPKTNVRLLYDGGMFNCNSFDVYDYASTGQTGLTQYPLFHHWDDPLNPSFDINFATCDFYYYDGYNQTNNTLYNLYWRRTVNQINTGKMLIAYFDLNEADIQSLKLNDKIRIDNSWWHINKVIDYDCNFDALTKVELMSVDSEIDFAPFKKKRPYKPNVTEYISATEHLIKNKILANNTIGQGADVVIKGYNNLVNPDVKAVVIGDGNVITEDGIYNDSTNQKENFANTDLTFDDNRTHNTDGYSMFLSTDNGAFTEASLEMSTTNANLLFGTKGILIDANGSFIKGAIKTSIFSPNSNTTLGATNHIVNCVSSTFTVTLPTAVGIQGREYIIKNSGTGVITLEADGTETIDGALNLTLATKVCYTVISDGANWIIINAF